MASLRGAGLKADLMSRPEPAEVARALALVAQAAERVSSYSELERGVSAYGVPYIVGGWSSQARCELAMQAAEFSVTLVFAHRGSCEYIADVNVRICNDRGDEIAALNDAGPIVLFGLAPGNYQVTVARNNQILTRTITVGPRTRRQTVFYWSAPDRDLSRSKDPK